MRTATRRSTGATAVLASGLQTALPALAGVVVVPDPLGHSLAVVEQLVRRRREMNSACAKRSALSDGSDRCSRM